MLDNAQKKNIYRIAILIIFVLLVGSSRVQAASVNQLITKGNRLFKQGEFDAAAEHYTQALETNEDSEIINFNLGTAFYKEEKFDQAAEHLQKTLLTEDEDLRRKAHYNLGNTLVQSGLAKETDNIDEAISDLEQSLIQYQEALTVSEGEEDPDARHNYEFAEKTLERLRIKEEQERQQAQDQKDSKDQSQSQDKDESQEPQPSKGDDGQKDDQPQQDQDSKNQDDNEQEDEGQDPSEAGSQSDEQGQQNRQDQSGQNKDQPTGQQDGKSGFVNPQQLTNKEAQMLLEQYQQTEEPQGLLNVNPQRGEGPAVMQDW